MLTKSCEEFVQVLASKAPVPGGGGACAYVAALGMALGSMVGNLTVGKKKYKAVEEEIQALLIESEALMHSLKVLVEKDAEAFYPLIQAYQLPKNTDQEKEIKENTLQEALVGAASIPLEIGRYCLKAIDLHEQFAKKGTMMAISDIGVGVAFCKAALQGAKLNVIINTKMMRDQALKDKMEEEIYQIEKEGIQKADKIFSDIEKLLIKE